MDKSIELQPVFIHISQGAPGQPFLVAEEEYSISQTEADSFLPEPRAETPKRRCSCAKIFIGFILFWILFSSLATLGFGIFASVKVQQCLSPPHYKDHSFSYSPEELRSIDLNVITGSIGIRTISGIENISVHVWQGALSTQALFTMEVRTSFNNGTLQIEAMGPSFDWHDCQLSYIEVRIPQGLIKPLVLQANVVVGQIHVDAGVFDNLTLTTSLGYIKTHQTNAGNLTVGIFAGFLKSKETRVDNEANIEIENGFIKSSDDHMNLASFAVGLGGIKTSNFRAIDGASMTTEIGAICSDIKGSLSAHVEYGYLRVKTEDTDFKFHLESEWGSVEASGSDKIFFDENDRKKKSGSFGLYIKNMTLKLTTTFGEALLVSNHVHVQGPWIH